MARKRKLSEVEDSEISCYYCNKPITDKAIKCPHCGKIFSVGKKVIAFSIVMIILIASLGIYAYNQYNAVGQEGYDGDDDIIGDDIIPPADDNSKKIMIELNTIRAPITTKNFIDLANQGKYTNVPFHRIIDDFMIQGGDFTNKDGTGGHAAEYHNGLGNPSDENSWMIPDEFHPELTHVRYAISMANAGANTGGSQFFIVTKVGGTDWLNNAHSVFGIVVDGFEHVDAMGLVATDGGDKPLSPVTLDSVKITTSAGKTYATLNVSY